MFTNGLLIYSSGYSRIDLSSLYPCLPHLVRFSSVKELQPNGGAQEARRQAHAVAQVLSLLSCSASSKS